MHRDIGFNRIIDMIIVIELNRETSADLHPYYLTLPNYLPIYPSTIQLCTQISTYLPIYPSTVSTAQLSIHLPPNYLSIYLTLPTYLLGMGHDFRIFEYSI